MKLDEPRIVGALEMVAAKANMLSSAVLELTAAVKGDLPRGTNPFGLEKKVEELYRELTSAYKKLTPPVMRAAAPLAKRGNVTNG